MILIIGAGAMAQEYAKVLIAKNLKFHVIGRGLESAGLFYQATGIQPYVEGFYNFFKTVDYSIFTHVIVTTGVEQLASITKQLIKVGFKEILVEKPAGLDLLEINDLTNFSLENSANIYVAYNRRFFSSVLKAKELIDVDGGVSSFNFELTEWGHTLESIPKANGVKENWFFANTTHVTDLAFYLGGSPVEIKSFHSGTSNWHNRSYNYAGAGVSNNGALFSYHGNWGAPGRWSVEVLTKFRRLILRPMEKLQVQYLGSIEIQSFEIDDKLDIEFKPGIYRQVEAFIIGDKSSLCDLKTHNNLCEIYSRMAGY